MTFWNWLRRENPEDKVLLELKDRRIQAMEGLISALEDGLAVAHERIAVLKESNSVLRKHRDLLRSGPTPQEPKTSKDLN